MNTALRTRVEQTVPVAVDEAALMTHLNRLHTRLDRHLEKLAPAMLSEVAQGRLLDASFSYVIHKAKKSAKGVIRLESGVEFFAPLVAHKMNGASYFVFSALTVGGAISECAGNYASQGQVMKSIIIEAIASCALFDLGRIVSEAIDEEADALDMMSSGYLSPGDSGFEITDQALVLELANSSAIKVSCTTTSSMTPQYSLTGVAAIGKKMVKWTQAETCKTCPSRERCQHHKMLSH